MKKRKLIILISTCLMLAALVSSIVYAAFTFSRKVVDEEVDKGQIVIESQKLLDYSPLVSKDIADKGGYFIKATTRVPKEVYEETSIDSAAMFNTAGTLYTKTGEDYSVAASYSAGTTYYVKKQIYEDEAISASTFKTDGSLFTAAEDNTVDSTVRYWKDSNDYYTLSNTNSGLNVKFTAVTSGSFDSKAKYYMKATYLQAVAQRSVYYTESNASNTMKECYATERGGYSDEVDLQYLNQFGIEFTFQTNIAVYVRVHILDAWYTSRYYTNSDPKKYYVAKDKIGGTSPFAYNIDTNNWLYDEATNCIYLKHMVTPTSAVLEENRSTYSFMINPDYFYESSSKVRESVIVQVSYSVDIVQANRANKKWGIDIDQLLS